VTPRWLLWAPVAALVAAGAVLGLKTGIDRAQLSETDAIERAAARYLSEAGPDARRTDCAAVPGRSAGVWLRVVCAPGAGAPRFEYALDRRGAIIDPGGRAAGPENRT